MWVEVFTEFVAWTYNCSSSDVRCDLYTKLLNQIRRNVFVPPSPNPNFPPGHPAHQTALHPVGVRRKADKMNAHYVRLPSMYHSWFCKVLCVVFICF